MIFIPNIQRVMIPQKRENWVTVDVSAHCLIVVYIFTKFRKNIFDSVEVTQRTRFSYQNLKRGVISQNVFVEFDSYSVHIV